MSSATNALPLLRTKLSIPGSTTDIVSRERLTRLLDQSFELPITLVSAPAGYGKSVLVSQWARQQKTPVVWLSLDPGESDVSDFMAYFLEALEQQFPGGFPVTRSLLKLPETTKTPVIASHLLNELGSLEQPCTIILDDYHQISAESEVHQLLGWILEHPPENIHIVLVTRRDPPLPIHRYRALNQLLEIRLQELRFNVEETSQLLEADGSSGISEQGLLVLDREIEGWAVGLRLFEMATRNRKNPERLLSRIQGGLPHVREYLVKEVLSGLPHWIREYLLETSILDRMCPDLVRSAFEPDSVTRKDHSALDFFNYLKTSNLFLIDIDPFGEWCRYHHLFQSILSEQLQQEYSADEIRNMHARSAQWFEDAGLIDEAIKHHLAAGQEQEAGEAVVHGRTQTLENDEWFVMERWLRRLPETVIVLRPELLMIRGHLAHLGFDLQTIANCIRMIEENNADTTMTLEYQAELHYLKGVVSYWSGDVSKAVTQTGKSLQLTRREPGVILAEMVLYHALGLQASDGLAAAMEFLNQRLKSSSANEPIMRTRQHAARAFVHIMAARPDLVVEDTRQLQRCGESAGSLNAVGWAHYLRGLGLLQTMELEQSLVSTTSAAEQHELIEKVAAIDNFATQVLAEALSGNMGEALKFSERQRAFAERSNDSHCEAVAASSRARLALLTDEPTLALAWAEAEPEVQSPTELFCWLEVPSITRARVLITAGHDAQIRSALESIRALKPEIQRLNNDCKYIELLVLEALALDRLGEEPAARESLTQAIGLALPGGWRRSFIEPGQPLQALLSQLRLTVEEQKFVDSLVNFSTQRVADQAQAQIASATADNRETVHGLNELTNREMDILELLAERLHNKEIASRLFISLHTVKDHLKHIYQKLDVNNRREAVQRSLELGIISER